MTLKKRVEVLFDAEEFAQLEQIASNRQTSIEQLIREAVDQSYPAPALEKRRQAVEWITSQQIDLGADWEELKQEMADRLQKELHDDLYP